MTTQKHLKRRVRERMSWTGERYAAARRCVAAPAAPDALAAPDAVSSGGIHPETAALRSALLRTGVTAPHSGRPWTEAMLFGLGGGVGIGVFAFHYAAEDVSSFYVAGRHLWDDGPSFLRAAAGRAGGAVEVLETGSARTAFAHLRDALAHGRGVIASVDVAPLRYRGVPAAMAGAGYHVVFVRSLDESAGTVEVEDLHPAPIVVAVADLADARARIRSQRHRLVTVGEGAAGAAQPLETSVHAALGAAADGLDGSLAPAAGGRRGRNFNLDALGSWADRLSGDRSADGWARMFPRGHRLWRGLASIAEYIDHAGTGGGLLRPLYARFLREAAGIVGGDLPALAARYEALGAQWSALAEAALPGDVPVLRETAALIARREQAFLERGARSEDEVRAIWQRLEAIEAEMRDAFPLSEGEVDELRADLAGRVRDLETEERAAVAALRAAAGQMKGDRE